MEVELVMVNVFKVQAQWFSGWGVGVKSFTMKERVHLIFWQLEKSGRPLDFLRLSRAEPSLYVFESIFLSSCDNLKTKCRQELHMGC